MKIEILIALIASITAVLTAIVSAYISLKTAKNSKDIESKKLRLQRLLKKQGDLEQAKVIISNEFLKKDGELEINPKSIADNIMNKFSLAKSLFIKYGHNLNKERFGDLNSQFDKLENDYGQAVAENYNTGDLTEETINIISKNLELMGKMKNVIDEEITKELIELNVKIDNMLV